MADATTRTNLRRARRQQAKTNTKLKAFRNALGLGPNIGVRALDVSEMGARLLLKEALPVGHEFAIEIEGPSGKPFKAVALLRWIVKAEDGTFVTGTSFDKSVAYAHLSALAR